MWDETKAEKVENSREQNPASQKQCLWNILTVKQNRNIPTFRWENLKAEQEHKGHSTGKSLMRWEQSQHCCAAAHAGSDSSHTVSWASLSSTTAFTNMLLKHQWLTPLLLICISMPSSPSPAGNWGLAEWLRGVLLKQEAYHPSSQLSLPGTGASPLLGEVQTSALWWCLGRD